MKKYITLVLLLLIAVTAGARHKATAEKWAYWGPTSQTGFGLMMRGGYVIGGTTPLPVPKTIYHINSFLPKGGLAFGVEGYKMFGPRWGMSVGLNFSWQGFYTNADVKNYYMGIENPDEETGLINVTKGWFTGCNESTTITTGLTIPVMATFRIGPRWNLSFGPFIEFFMSRKFEAEVYCSNSKQHELGLCKGGYLRVDETDDNGVSLGLGPTGGKQDIHKEPGKHVGADMSKDMRKWAGGLEIMFDWKALKHMNVFGKLDWGLSSAFPKSFETVPKMYPIYGTLGVAYRY